MVKLPVLSAMLRLRSHQAHRDFDRVYLHRHLLKRNPLPVKEGSSGTPRRAGGERTSPLQAKLAAHLAAGAERHRLRQTGASDTEVEVVGAVDAPPNATFASASSQDDSGSEGVVEAFVLAETESVFSQHETSSVDVLTVLPGGAEITLGSSPVVADIAEENPSVGAAGSNSPLAVGSETFTPFPDSPTHVNALTPPALHRQRVGDGQRSAAPRDMGEGGLQGHSAPKETVTKVPRGLTTPDQALVPQVARLAEPGLLPQGPFTGIGYSPVGFPLPGDPSYPPQNAPQELSTSLELEAVARALMQRSLPPTRQSIESHDTRSAHQTERSIGMSRVDTGMAEPPKEDGLPPGARVLSRELVTARRRHRTSAEEIRLQAPEPHSSENAAIPTEPMPLEPVSSPTPVNEVQKGEGSSADSRPRALTVTDVVPEALNADTLSATNPDATLQAAASLPSEASSLSPPDMVTTPEESVRGRKGAQVHYVSQKPTTSLQDDDFSEHRSGRSIPSDTASQADVGGADGGFEHRRTSLPGSSNESRGKAPQEWLELLRKAQRQEAESTPIQSGKAMSWESAPPTGTRIAETTGLMPGVDSRARYSVKHSGDEQITRGHPPSTADARLTPFLPARVGPRMDKALALVQIPEQGTVEWIHVDALPRVLTVKRQGALPAPLPVRESNPSPRNRVLDRVLDRPATQKSGTPGRLDLPPTPSPLRDDGHAHYDPLTIAAGVEERQVPDFMEFNTPLRIGPMGDGQKGRSEEMDPGDASRVAPENMDLHVPELEPAPGEAVGSESASGEAVRSESASGEAVLSESASGEAVLSESASGEIAQYHGVRGALGSFLDPSLLPGAPNSLGPQKRVGISTGLESPPGIDKAMSHKGEGGGAELQPAHPMRMSTAASGPVMPGLEGPAEVETLKRVEPSQTVLDRLTTYMGFDVREVPLWQERQEAGLTRRVRADAMTIGHEVILGPGVKLNDPRGEAVLAHELTHVARRDSPHYLPPILRARLRSADSAVSDQIAARLIRGAMGEETLAETVEVAVLHEARRQELKHETRGHTAHGRPGASFTDPWPDASRDASPDITNHSARSSEYVPKENASAGSPVVIPGFSSSVWQGELPAWQGRATSPALSGLAAEPTMNSGAVSHTLGSGGSLAGGLSASGLATPLIQRAAEDRTLEVPQQRPQPSHTHQSPPVDVEVLALEVYRRVRERMLREIRNARLGG